MIGILLTVFVALLFSGCGLVTPGEPSAKVTITSVSGYWWQTKGSGVELSLKSKCYCHELDTKVTPTGAGTATGDGNYCNGVIVPISATANSGYVFDFWTKNHGSIADESAASTTFTMPSLNSEVIAHFKVKCCEDGEDGENGITPHIGENGNWYIGDSDTGIPATGPAGADGEIGPIGADGIAGNTPYIIDGFWWIDGVTTGIPATGPQGETGNTGDSGATGQTGATGPQGPAGQDYVLPESIYVYYTITNTGNVNIQEYTIIFSAETDNGVYTGIATGTDLAVGTFLYSYVKIDVFNNEVVFVDYSLEVK